MAIKLGMFTMPFHHPSRDYFAILEEDQDTVKGRFIMGIGPGGLASDLETFDLGQPEARPQMVLESIDTILRLWSQDPLYSRTRRSRCRCSRLARDVMPRLA